MMREEYDFSNARKNPYIGKLKREVTISIDDTIMDFFKNKEEESGIPYQTLMTLYLSDCVENNREIQIIEK